MQELLSKTTPESMVIFRVLILNGEFYFKSLNVFHILYVACITIILQQVLVLMSNYINNTGTIGYVFITGFQRASDRKGGCNGTVPFGASRACDPRILIIISGGVILYELHVVVLVVMVGGRCDRGVAVGGRFHYRCVWGACTMIIIIS